jgi:aminopeptidase N
MREGQSKVIYRSDYQPPAFWIDAVELVFDLDPAKTRVLNRMRIRRNPDVPPQALRLDGEELNLSRVLVAGQGTSFKMEDNQLVLENLPEGNEPFELEIFTTCYPAKNTKLMGLYVSNDSFFTQCEAEGFRRITYFLDRPDVMASYTVTLRADPKRYPCCCPTATWWKKARWKTAAISPGGSTRTASPRTCSRWSRASWWRASSASPPAPATTTCCRSTCALATWTRPSTP